MNIYEAICLGIVIGIFIGTSLTTIYLLFLKKILFQYKSKNNMKNKILRLKRYDPNIDIYSLINMIRNNEGNYIYFDDLMELFE